MIGVMLRGRGYWVDDGEGLKVDVREFMGGIGVVGMW